MVRLGGDTQESKPDADLRDALHAMEAKVRKLREVRNQHNDNARRSADQRNSCQAQYKEHKEKLDLVLTEVKAIRAEIKLFKEKRNAIQDQIRDIISQAKGKRSEKGEKRSATAEYTKLKSEVEQLEKIFETTSVGVKKEKEMMSKLKNYHRRLAELEPEVANFEMVSVDLSDLDTAIKTLRAEADAAHQAMMDAVTRANEKSGEVDEAFNHRDFLKSEGDRYHNEFVAAKEKANDVHSKIEEMMVDVNEARDKLNAAKEERKSWMVDHNKAVEAEMKTGAESDEVADALTNSLLETGSLVFGGTAASDSTKINQATSSKSKKKKSMRRIDMNASRKR